MAVFVNLELRCLVTGAVLAWHAYGNAESFTNYNLPPCSLAMSWRLVLTLNAWRTIMYTAAHLRTIIQSVSAGSYRGLGFGLGAMVGGVLYGGLGAQVCFGVCNALPVLSLLLLAAPTTRRWSINSGGHLRVRIEAAGRGGPGGGWWFECREKVGFAAEMPHPERGVGHESIAQWVGLCCGKHVIRFEFSYRYSIEYMYLV